MFWELIYFIFGIFIVCFSVICGIHGKLSEDQCYKRSRNGRTDYDCKSCVRKRANNRYIEKKEQINAHMKAHYQKPEVKEQYKERWKKRYFEKSEEIIEYVKDWNLKLKIEVLSHYSVGEPKCKRCDETELKFLSLDHINEDGAEHRKKIVKSSHMCAWAKRNDFPEEIFQVLCHNCNMFKHFEHIGLGKSASARHLLKLKNLVLSHYSGGNPKCAQCKVTDIRILSIDHMDGGGNIHRRSLPSKGGGNSKVYRYLRDSNFPAGFQVLCFNHNLGKHCLGS